MKKLILLPILFIALTSFAQRGDWLVLNLKGYWKFTIGDKMEYAEEDYNDSDWDEIFVPSAWENEGYHGYDGYAWYRVGFELNSNTIEEEALFLDLGYIDDVDEVYVNGERIGFTGGFPPNFYTAHRSRRRYYLPKDLLKKNQTNTIAVRVFDTVLDGGIMSGTIGIFSSEEGLPMVQQLQGIWKIKSRQNDEWRDPNYDDSDWSETMVPGFWGDMKYERPMSNIATYRKTFELVEYIDPTEELVVILGRIDDFDEVYLNGELIGKTKDYRPLGNSDSYREMRVYDLPEDLINFSGDNTLTVEVEDIGGNAGIYEGPIVITYRKNYRRVISQYDDNTWRW